MTTQSEIFESYVHDIKYRLMLAKRIIFDDANSDWPDDAIAAFFKARFECVGDPIYRDCVKRLATAFVSNPANEESFDLYAKRADRVFKTEVSSALRDMLNDMDKIKRMLGLKPKRIYRHSESLKEDAAKVVVNKNTGASFFVDEKRNSASVTITAKKIFHAATNKSDVFFVVDEMKVDSGLVSPASYADIIKAVDIWSIGGFSSPDLVFSFSGKCRYGNILIEAKPVNDCDKFHHELVQAIHLGEIPTVVISEC
jgi:hypothetical protein